MSTAVVRRHGAYLLAAISFVFLPVATTPSFAYDRKDAGLVTTSKNKAVLDYIVCLEAAVAGTPKRMTIEASLDRAEAACRAKAAKLPQSRKEPNVADIRSMIMECGFRAGEGSSDMGCEAASTETTTPDTAGQKAAPPVASGQYVLSDMEKNAIMNGVRVRLKDPASAILGGVVAKREANGFVYVCGSINAKNSYGGYTGDQPYSGMLAGEGPKVFFAVLGIGGLDCYDEQDRLCPCRNACPDGMRFRRSDHARRTGLRCN